jgi:hypothetical protein
MGAGVTIVSLGAYVFFKSQRPEACKTFSSCENCGSLKSCTKQQAVEYRNDER